MRAFLLVLTLLLCSLPRFAHSESVSAATAEEKSQAQRYFQAGVSLQKTEDFDAAIAAYETSLQLFATKSALFNLANCQRAVHRYADAWNSLHRLRAEFGPELVEPMSSTSEAQLEELENLTGLLTIETRPTGATITIDGKPGGPTPWASPLRVTIGKHVVQAALDGYIQKDTTIELTPKQSLAILLELDAAGNVASAPVPTPDPIATTSPSPTATETHPPAAVAPSGPSPTWRTAGWVGMTLGVIGIAAGARTGVLALGVDERLREVCEAGQCSRSYGSDVERLERLTMSTNLFIGAGTLLLAAGATLVLWPSTPDAPEQLNLTLSPTAVRLGGCF